MGPVLQYSQNSLSYFQDPPVIITDAKQEDRNNISEKDNCKSCSLDCEICNSALKTAIYPLYFVYFTVRCR